MTDYTEALVIKINESSDKKNWILYVQCPFCNKVHKHGESLILNRRYFGTRLSHCVGLGMKEYLLVRACKIPEY